MVKDYYNSGGEQLIDKMAREYSFNDFMAFCRMNAEKYETRNGKKDGATDDAIKADTYRAYAHNRQAQATFEPILGGFLRLVACDGKDKTIDSAARISYSGDNKERTDEEVSRLINRLMREWHTSPFEQVHFTFEIKAPVFVLRQWIRHRMVHVNEQSARYTKTGEGEFYFPDAADVRTQHGTDKQAGGDAVDNNVAEDFRNDTLAAADTSYKTYERHLNSGVARELARINLPQTMFSRMVWKIDAHNLFHFMRLRSDWHAQLEIRRYSDCIQKIVERELPLSYAAWVNHRRDSVTLSAAQWAAVKERINIDNTDLTGVEARELAAKLSA